MLIGSFKCLTKSFEMFIVSSFEDFQQLFSMFVRCSLKSHTDTHNCVFICTTFDLHELCHVTVGDTYRPQTTLVSTELCLVLVPLFSFINFTQLSSLYRTPSISGSCVAPSTTIETPNGTCKYYVKPLTSPSLHQPLY